MEVKINTSPISYFEKKAVMTFELSGDLVHTEAVGVDLVENGIGPFVQPRDRRKAIRAMLWSEITERINTLMDEADIPHEHSPEFDEAFNEAGKQ
jgi:hypothetical protein